MPPSAVRGKQSQLELVEIQYRFDVGRGYAHGCRLCPVSLTSVLEGIECRVLPLVNLTEAALRCMTMSEVISSRLELWYWRVEPMVYCEKCEIVVLDDEKHKSELGHRPLKLLY